MDRRSWYMPKADASELAGLLDDLHFATRRPKHEIMSAMVHRLSAQREAIRDDLSHT